MDTSTLKSLMLNDNGFAFEPQTGDSFQLSPVGIHIVRKLLEQQSEDSIVHSITNEFEVSTDIARRDLEGFLLSLNELQLIRSQ